ncbi:hypothetical protein [Oceanobacillus rekensis]|uniref:hypothetical protein n=1 Tax=Oceanobacillus rekensis TaxID=937927 RepID=UPI0015949218|nr:hypothetical protein [Oceanobacillus rekensis]
MPEVSQIFLPELNQQELSLFQPLMKTIEQTIHADGYSGNYELDIKRQYLATLK